MKVTLDKLRERQKWINIELAQKRRVDPVILPRCRKCGNLIPEPYWTCQRGECQEEIADESLTKSI